MPCMKCSNGKWKYGKHGKCVFDTLEACQAAAAAIHIQDKSLEGANDEPCCGKCNEELSMQDLFNQVNTNSKF